MDNIHELVVVVVLGLIQGFTEFLPISSSGHLVLLERFFKMKDPPLFFATMLHVGTLGAIFLVYYREIWNIAREFLMTLFKRRFYRAPVQVIAESPALRMAWLIVLGCIPAAFVGLLWEDFIEAMCARPIVVACMLIVTGLLLQLSRKTYAEKHRRQELNIWDMLRIGIAQAFAIMPGISRSGATISIALFTGVSPQIAAQYSFLLSIPAILGASLLKLKDLHAVSLSPYAILTGMLIAFASGYLALRVLLRTLNRGRFSVFSYYCFGLGLFVIAAILFRK